MPLLDVDDCALLIIDAQPDFYADSDPKAKAALARAAWLAVLANAMHVPTVVTEEDRSKNGPTDPAIRAALRAGTPILDKPTFAVTGTSSIVEAIQVTDRGTIVVVGFETDVCVAQSAVGLTQSGYRVVVVADAVYSPGEMHLHGLDRISRAGVEINHTKGVAYEWVRTVSGSREVIDANPLLNPAPFAL